MKSIWHVALVSVALLLASLCGHTAIAGDDGKPAAPTTVEYRASGKDTIASIVFSSDATARMSMRDGKVVDLKWTAYAEPRFRLRVVSAAHSVWWFDWDEGGLLSIPGDARFRRADGKMGLPEMFLQQSKLIEISYAESKQARVRESLVLVTDQLLDLITATESIECRYTRTKDDKIEASMPDGTKRSFLASERGFEDVARRVQFESLSALRLDACVRNLEQLVKCFVVMRDENPAGAVKYAGAAWFCDVANTYIRLGDERVLFCPADPNASAPADDMADRALWRSHLDPKNPPADCCSYATRNFARFALDKKVGAGAAVLCCRGGSDGRTPHHRSGVVVAFEDGTVKFMKRPALGLGPDDPIVVGPDSKSPILKTMIYLPAKK